MCIKMNLPKFTKIETQEEYQEALYIIENYMHEMIYDNYIDRLADLVEEYEDKHFPMG